jgi:hypothetical protein
MTSEQYDKMNELARRLRNFGDTKVKCDVDLTDDYFKVSEFNPSEGFVTITKSDGDFLAEFPISSLSEAIIGNVLWDAACTIAKVEAGTDKVLDMNYYATL